MTGAEEATYDRCQQVRRRELAEFECDCRRADRINRTV